MEIQSAQEIIRRAAEATVASAEQQNISQSALLAFEAKKRWANLKTFINSYFYQIDFDALAIVLSACVSHRFNEFHPIWLMVLGPAGAGKCLRPDTLVLKYDGTIVRADSIEVGDLLMGDDSTPRKVLSTITGKEEMYEIKPVKGDSYYVNKSHILSLKMSYAAGWKKKHEVVDIPIESYLSMSNTFKQAAKGYRVAIDYPEVELSIHPYLLGVLLGDGSLQETPILTNPDEELVAEIKSISEQDGYGFHQNIAKNRCNTFSFVAKRIGQENPLTRKLRDLQIWGKTSEFKFVPTLYKINSAKNRLEVLAGLLDTDGHLSSRGTYDFISKSEALADDVIFLSRSLGLAAYKTKCIKGCQTGFKGIYYRVSISGNLDKIPCRITRKKAQPRRQKKDVLSTGITVTSVGVGDYCGFELDGNGRFLLGDFTVTHNTSIFIGAAKTIEETIVLGDITPNSLISGWREGQNGNARNVPKEFGILQTMGNSGILLFKDFTTFISKRHEDRTAIASQLREVYDGYMPKHTGATGKLDWEGKASVIAVATPAIEAFWRTMSSLGERFLQLRLDRPDGVELARFAKRQAGKRKWLDDELSRYTREFLTFEPIELIEDDLDEEESGLIYLSEIVALSRAGVTKERRNGQDIITDIDMPEGPTRIMQTLSQLARTHASMFRKEKIDQEDLNRARRVAFDSIPPNKLSVITSLPRDGHDVMQPLLQQQTLIPRTSMRRLLEEMEAHEIVVRRGEAPGEIFWRLSDKFIDLLERAKV